MAADTIKTILLINDPEERTKLKRILYTDELIEVVAETESFKVADQAIKDHQPEIIIVSDEIEEGKGIDYIRKLYVKAPDLSAILYISEATTVDNQQIFLEAMRSGAHDCIIGLSNPEVIIRQVKRDYEDTVDKRYFLKKLISGEEELEHLCKIISVFSTKGGVGRSLISVNLAAEMAKHTKKSVCLIDLDLQFGDVAIMLDLKPTKTIKGLAEEIEAGSDINDELVKKYTIVHETSGLNVICAPLKPQEAELIKGEHISKAIQAASKVFNYIIVDNPNYLNDTVLSALDMSDLILLILTLELPTIKNGKLMIELMETLHYSKDKVKIVMNRDNPKIAIKTKEVEEALNFPVIASIPSDGKATLPSVNDGVPFVLSRQPSPIATAIKQLSLKMLGEDSMEEGAAEAASSEGTAKKGFLSSLFGGGKKKETVKVKEAAKPLPQEPKK